MVSTTAMLLTGERLSAVYLWTVFWLMLLCGWCRIILEGTTVFKQIKHFRDYERQQRTSLAAIQQAYAIAGRAADKAELEGHPQYLVSCTLPPRMLRSQQYQVRTSPRGYLSTVSSEQVTLFLSDR